MTPIVYGSGTGSALPPIPPLTTSLPGNPLNPSAGLLSLEEWRKMMHYHPWHFWGCAGTGVPVNSRCNSVVHQYAWQEADAAGREDITNAIVTAEERLTTLLGYAPAPHYREFVLPWPRYAAGTNLHWLGYSGSDRRWESLALPEGQIQAAGLETLSELALAAPLVASDADGDGLNESFTVTVALGALVAASEIAVYHAAANRLDGEGPLERWRIRPLKVTVDAGTLTATIQGKLWQVVRPILYEGVTGTEINPASPASFASTLDVYRRYPSSGDSYATAQAVLIWETPPYPAWLLYPATTTDPAGWAYTLARVGIRDAEKGIISIGEAIYDSSNQTWSAVPWFSNYRFRPPDRVIVRVLCGVPQAAGSQMDDRMTRIVSRLATAEMARRICACESANKEVYHWQFDLARTSGNNDEAYNAISHTDLSNPLGTRRGQVYAWKETQINRALRGFVP